MSTVVIPKVPPEAEPSPIVESTETVVDQTDQRLELHQRFVRALVADPEAYADIPPDALLFLLPVEEPAYVAGEIAAGVAAIGQGENVYFRHIRSAELPAPLTPDGPTAGLRRTAFNWDGSVFSRDEMGSDGEWHEVEPQAVEDG